MKKIETMIDSNRFKTLHEFVMYFSNEDVCRNYIIQTRWNNKVKCAHCNSEKIYAFKDGIRYKCGEKDCLKKFTITVGTIFENTKIPLTKWFVAIYLTLSHKKGISSIQLSKDIGVTQKTAWFLLHRIREMIKEQGVVPFSGSIEIDETFIGGKNKNRHPDKKVKNSQGRSFKDKTPVLGILQSEVSMKINTPNKINPEKLVERKVIVQSGKVRSIVVHDTSGETIKPFLFKYIEEGSKITTDEWKAYNGLTYNFNHSIVDHSKKQYCNNGNTTNRIENYWSQVKRTIIGTYHWTSRKHMNRYCSEFDFRYNTKDLGTIERINFAFNNCETRLKYKDLTKNRYISMYQTM